MSGKRRTPEEQLQELRISSETLSGDAAIAAVERALAARSNLVVEFAAKLVVQQELNVSVTLLLDAYHRFLKDPLEIDKGCRAKLPLVEALTNLELDDPEFFLVGMKYTQFEPVWGKSEDTAGNLRGACAYGLIRSRTASPANTIIALVDLLGDPDKLARTHAARAISATGSSSSVPVLRLKASLGDASFEVMGECFRGLLENDVTSSVDFVAGFLKQETDLAIEAATALGECRNEAALQTILAACDQCSGDLTEVFYISIGLSRLPAAIDFLLQRISVNSTDACLALKALAPIRFYPGISDQVEKAVRTTADKVVTVTFDRLFR